MLIHGLDFTSAPTPKKPITRASGRLDGDTLHIETIHGLGSFPAFESFLSQPGPWTAGIDFPFGQPRKLIENMGWPRSWASYVGMVSGLSKEGFDTLLKDYRDQRPSGDKQHLRRTDELAEAKSPMMMYGVPVGKMFFEGAPRLLKSGASILPCHPTEDSRVVVEAYPALVARRWGGNQSYKSEEKRKQTPERESIRVAILAGLLSKAKGHFGFDVEMPGRLVIQCIQDHGGDKLDAVLCAVQAAWAYSRREANYGIPQEADPLEGWIIDPRISVP